MGESPTNQEKLQVALLDEGIHAGLFDLINGYKEELLTAIDAAPEQKKIYQYIGERRACTNILIRLDGLRNRSKENRTDEESPT